MSLKGGENVVRVSNSLDLDAHGTIVVLSELRVRVRYPFLLLLENMQEIRMLVD